MDAKQYLTEYVKAQGYEPTDDVIVEILTDYDNPTLYTERVEEHRWYDLWLRVKKIGDRFVGYFYPENTGDMSIRDMGLEFDWDSLKEYVAKEVTTTIYVPKE